MQYAYSYLGAVLFSLSFLKVPELFHILIANLKGAGTTFQGILPLPQQRPCLGVAPGNMLLSEHAQDGLDSLLIALTRHYDFE